MKKIRVTDATLLQASNEKKGGISFKERIEIAKLLDRLGYDTILLPKITNSADALLVRTIAQNVTDTTLALLCDASNSSIDEAWNAIGGAAKSALCVSLPLSNVGMEYLCHIKSAKMPSIVASLVASAKEKAPFVIFRAEDALRATAEVLASTLNAAKDAGADEIIICDNVGDCSREDIEKVLSAVEFDNISVSISNDYSISCASALNALTSGAAGVECDLCAHGGINAQALEKLIAAKGDSLGLSCSLDGTVISRTAELINKTLSTIASSPIVNGIKSGAGEEFELSGDCDIGTVIASVEKLGYDLDKEDTAKVYNKFLDITKSGKTVTERDLDAIVAATALQVKPTYRLECYTVTSCNKVGSTASVVFEREGARYTGVAAGNGPIDAAFIAIEQIIGSHFELDDFQIRSVTEGREAMGEALVRLRFDGKLYSGIGISTDVIGASISAYLNALNKILFEQ